MPPNLQTSDASEAALEEPLTQMLPAAGEGGGGGRGGEARKGLREREGVSLETRGQGGLVLSACVSMHMNI